MTKKEVNQIYYLNREIEMWQEHLRQLREKEMQSPKLNGMPSRSVISDSVASKAVELADTELMIESLLVRVQLARKKIYEYIDSLDDSLIRQIIMYRCISLCTWEEVAIYVGGRNSAESVRKIFDRHFDNTD